MTRWSLLLLLSTLAFGCAAQPGDGFDTETDSSGLIRPLHVRAPGGRLDPRRRRRLHRDPLRERANGRHRGALRGLPLEQRAGELRRLHPRADPGRPAPLHDPPDGRLRDDLRIQPRRRRAPPARGGGAGERRGAGATGGRAPARGEAVTIYGFGCQARGGGGAFSKQAFGYRWGETTYNLCPGDSGGPTLTGDGEVIQVNSAYVVGPGNDLFGDVPAHLADLRRYVDSWRGSDPLVWVGDAPPPSDPPPSDPPSPPPSDPPSPPPSDPPPGGPVDIRCGAHLDCASCSEDSYCGWCNDGCHGLHLDGGRLAGNGCTERPVIAPWSCPPPGAEPPPPPPPTPEDPPPAPEDPPPAGDPPPVAPSPSACGGWSIFTEYTCADDARQFIRCGASGVETAICPDGYVCTPGSTELLCYWGG